MDRARLGNDRLDLNAVSQSQHDRVSSGRLCVFVSFLLALGEAKAWRLDRQPVGMAYCIIISHIAARLVTGVYDLCNR
jgi:hypothetical protein